MTLTDEVFEQVAESITIARMEYLGFAYDEVLIINKQNHADFNCDFDGQDYDCLDENGVSKHKDFDTMGEIAELVCFVLENENLSQAIRALGKVDDEN